VTFWKWNDNLIVLFELWRSILKMDMFYCKNWPCNIVIKSKISTGCNLHVLGWQPQPCVSSLQLDVGYPVVIAATIPDAMLLPTDELFVQEVPEQVYDDLTCPKYALCPKEHPANCPLRWRLSNGLGVYLSWLQAGFSHHTRQPIWWSVNQRRLATSCWV
jgi:hypothetical protein